MTVRKLRAAMTAILLGTAVAAGSALVLAVPDDVMGEKVGAVEGGAHLGVAHRNGKRIVKRIIIPVHF